MSCVLPRSLARHNGLHLAWRFSTRIITVGQSVQNESTKAEAISNLMKWTPSCAQSWKPPCEWVNRSKTILGCSDTIINNQNDGHFLRIQNIRRKHCARWCTHYYSLNNSLIFHCLAIKFCFRTRTQELISRETPQPRHTDLLPNFSALTHGERASSERLKIKVAIFVMKVHSFTKFESIENDFPAQKWAHAHFKDKDAIFLITSKKQRNNKSSVLWKCYAQHARWQTRLCDSAGNNFFFQRLDHGNPGHFPWNGQINILTLQVSKDDNGFVRLQ